MSVLLRYRGNAINKPLLRLVRLLTIIHVWGSYTCVYARFLTFKFRTNYSTDFYEIYY
jgi:hypothetical protein